MNEELGNMSKMSKVVSPRKRERNGLADLVSTVFIEAGAAAMGAMIFRKIEAATPENTNTIHGFNGNIPTQSPSAFIPHRILVFGAPTHWDGMGWAYINFFGFFSLGWLGRKYCDMLCEQDLLDLAPCLTPTSRLACQVGHRGWMGTVFGDVFRCQCCDISYGYS